MAKKYMYPILNSLYKTLLIKFKPNMVQIWETNIVRSRKPHTHMHIYGDFLNNNIMLKHFYPHVPYKSHYMPICSLLFFPLDCLGYLLLFLKANKYLLYFT